jgi:hypothetical protein
MTHSETRFTHFGLCKLASLIGQGMGPDQRFYEWDLMIHYADFEALRAEGLLIRDLEAERSDFCITKWGSAPRPGQNGRG